MNLVERINTKFFRNFSPQQDDARKQKEAKNGRGQQQLSTEGDDMTNNILKKRKSRTFIKRESDIEDPGGEE